MYNKNLQIDAIIHIKINKQPKKLNKVINMIFDLFVLCG